MEEDYWTKHKGGPLGQYRRVKDCHVVVELSHVTAVDFPMQAHPINCSAYGHLTCLADAPGEGLNYETVPVEGPHPTYEDLGTQRQPKPGLIEGFPEQTGGIGPSDLATNGGFGPGVAGFKALLDRAWDSAVNHGKKLAEDDKCCLCKRITVIFWLGGSMGDEVKVATEMLKTWCEGGLERECRKKEIPVK